jgi:hypothetical protein
MKVAQMDRPGRLKHLLVAFPRSPKRCALAKACRRMLKVDGASIGVGYSYLVKGAKAIRFATSEAVAREVVSFDRNRDFAPGRYLLSPVSKSARLGGNGQAHGENGNGHSPKHTKRIIHTRTARVRELV